MVIAMLEKDGWTMTVEYSLSECTTARELMGLRSTDFESLLGAVTWGYLHCPDDHVFRWHILLIELVRRIDMMSRL